MLAIEVSGARVLLDCLQSIQEGHQPTEKEIEAVLAANKFFVDFYSSWEGSNRDAIKKIIRYFNKTEFIPPGILPGRLAEGFQRAVSEKDLMDERIAWLKKVEAASIAEYVLDFLPTGTRLDSVIHMTIDLFNNAFVDQTEMGVSLLIGAADQTTFVVAVSHELHHIGFRFWANQDRLRQGLLQEKEPRAVAVMHIQNLLSEGIANYYLSPGYVFRASSQELPLDPFQNRLARLQAKEKTLFDQAEAILEISLDPHGKYETCLELFKTIALDLEEAMLPAGHYLGARMVQTIDHSYPRRAILDCVMNLPQFLPLYNEAARITGGRLFNPALVDRFTSLWNM